MEPILKVEKLTKVFSRSGQDALTAVNDISFSLNPGECLGIIGESGSGKTTLVNLITRLQDATSGNIVLDGMDVTHLKGKELRKVYRKMQMVFQTPTDSFDPRRTLGDGIGESLRNIGMSRKETREEVERLLGKCSLPADFADRYPHQVSGGQCQRAAIARALAIEPKLLICDEATSALDTISEKQIQEATHNLAHDRTTLIVAHRLSTIRDADRIAVVENGGIAEIGTYEELIEKKGAFYEMQRMQI